MPIKNFLSKVQSIYATDNATEHSYRSAFETLFAALGVTALNEPKRVKCGAPDFIISDGELVIGHVEAKDLHIGIRAMKDSNKEQQERYKAALPNLIYTNGLDWDFYRDGVLTASVTIADYLMGITPKPDQYEALENLLRDFIAQKPQTITSPRDLAERMAGKANLIKDVLRKTLADDPADQSELLAQYQAFKENLIHDITPEDFADIYAETIAYGMFAARLHDTTLDTFSRQEALELLPKSNPFLRSLFGYVAGHDLDERIVWIIDDLARVFQACDVAKIMHGFGKLTGQNDPFLHFYETFLAAYNPSKRKARGVWYTPEPVVNFIVRAVDEVLQKEFGLPDGLADTSKVTIDWDTGQTDKKGKAQTIKKDVHRVQILDPATGTGTFLAEVIKQIAPKIKGVAPGMWSKYIEDDLIQRLHGFELLMASYAMCHMKLDMILTEMGYKPTGNPPRLSVYLTNSLEEGEPANQALPFSQWLSREAKGANTIKRDMPIMCVIGNPPYLGEGGVSEGWIGSLMDDYKKEPGGKVKLKERNPKWLNDLYVKFIRLSSHLIEKNGEGVLGFITNHGYLDNPTFRGMRWHLLKTFDKIWVLDLHGNAKKKEVTPEGKPDKNVFDIQQGVSIIIGVKKKGGGKGLAEVMQGDLWGARAAKYEALEKASLSAPLFEKLDSPAPQHPLVRRDFDIFSRYEIGFKLVDFMPLNGTGIVTKRDKLTVHRTPDGVRQAVKDMINLPEADVRTRYSIPADVRDWRYDWARADVTENATTFSVPTIAYRPFDTRYIYYSGRSRGFVGWPVPKIMRHMLAGQNFGIGTARSNKNPQVDHFYCVNTIMETKCAESSTQSALFPLYLYPDDQDLDQTRRVNFDAKLYKRLQKLAAHPDKGIPDELAVFDYIYGALHCPAYRETYAQFLKIDFPRIPWPKTPDEFWDVSAKGTELRKLHLMEPAAIGQTPFPFTGDGDNMVDKPRFEAGKVWINDSQYFDSAPEVSWGFYIGGYQPAQKWLKDRKARALTFDDVKHYQRILKVLHETDRVMKTITMDLA
ncbi:DNA methyltransferase [Pseudorhodobacter sp. E13]|uniref:type ISP restriction/modification enzyme n=1 Tax=Pseudorhodobacter sp. E13 TaxID=2487931 RepID=UPI000F8E8024|nr:type ISP restriction/modification enzyme [Pseudorhodobacter sp. E13]RUS64914.1 DNA methyltransferase [Pseudorhodobacter sp. E13]